jgi:hypothetical protein
MQHEPPDDAQDQPVKTRRMLGVGMYEGVEWGSNQRPVFRAGVLLRGRVRSLAAGLGRRFGVQVGQMLGVAEQRSERIVDA